MDDIERNAENLMLKRFDLFMFTTYTCASSDASE